MGRKNDKKRKRNGIEKEREIKVIKIRKSSK